MNDKRCFLLIMGSLFLLIGCGSRVPYPIAYPLQTQKRMQAAKHWEVLAEDVANQVKTQTAAIDCCRRKPVYVVPKQETPFETIFHEILLSKLVSSGIAVSATETGAMTMEYTVRMLEHSDRNDIKIPFKYTALATGIAVARDIADWSTGAVLGVGVAAGTAADVALSHSGGAPSHKEIIVTTTLADGGTFLIHQSDIYYINDPDSWHYVKESPPEHESAEQQGRRFDVVN